MNAVIDGGASLTLKAGGNHIVINPAGIFTSVTPVNGGSPVAATLASPILPLSIESTPSPTLAPKVDLKAAKQLGASYCPICEDCVDCKLGTYQLTFHMTNDDDEPYQNTDYLAFMPDGTIKEGTTDEYGYTETFYTEKEEEIAVHLLINTKIESEQGEV